MEIENLLKILLSAVLGGIIGFEREMSQKEPGLRTNILITIGSTLLTILSLKLAELSNAADPTRLVAQIIIAAGLLGAGVIIRARFSVQGLTSAAFIWISAVIGISVGIGYYLTSFIITVFVVLIFTSLKYISFILDPYKKLYGYTMSTEDKASVLIEIKKIITELGINYINANLRKVEDGYEIEIALSTSKTKNREFVEKVMQLPGVKEITSEHL